MTKEDILLKIKGFILALEINAGKEDISDHAHLFQDEVIDSMAFVEVVQFIESHFNIILDDDAIFSNGFSTLEGIADYIYKKIPESLICD